MAVALGLTGGSLYFITENYALTYGYCSNVSLIVCLTPLVTALIVGCFYPSERLDRRGLLASLIAFAGMALVVFIVLPISCAYPFFQRFFIQGLTIGSVKG